MKWRLSVHGAIVVVAIGVSSVAVAQPSANDGTTLGQLTAIKVVPSGTWVSGNHSLLEQLAVP